MNETYFFDTYAIFEIIQGNSNYDRYKDCGLVTTIFNISEMNYALKREGNLVADAITRKYSKFIVEVEPEDVMAAMDLRVKKRSLSIPDAIGYTVANKIGVKFLTGDKEFEKMPNVEFVK